MPKRIVDGEGVWGSDKILRLREDFQPEYANLIPLAEANGVFEVNPHKVWARVYAYNRRDKSLEWVQELLNDLIRVGLLLIWEDEGKLWGYWDGSEKSGRLPGEAERKKYKNLPRKPPGNLLEVSKETHGRLGGISTELPMSLPPRFGLVSIGMVSIGLNPAGPDSDNSENPLNGQEDKEMNLKNFKTEMAAAGAKRGFKVNGYQQTWEDLIILTKAHSSQAVINDFDAFLSENRGVEFPKGVLSKYQYVAADRLLGEAPALAEVKSPALTNLNREMTHLSGGVIAFIDKQKVTLAELLRDWTEEEVLAVFKEWLADQDLTDAKNVQYLPGKFVQTADSRCYSLRRKREEKVSEGLARERAVERLQEAANAEQQEADKKRQAESEQFDPLADLLGAE